MSEPSQFQKDRTISKTRGCWSCVSYCNDEKAVAHWMARRREDNINVFLPKGMDEPPLYAQTDQLIRQGKAGLCMKGNPMGQGEFVHYGYDCAMWSGRSGHSVEKGRVSIEPLPGEYYQIKKK